MAARKAPSGPPSPAAREHLLQTVAATTEPLPAKSLAKLLQPPHKLSVPAVTAILEEEVAASRMFSIPAATLKGAIRYWDRDAPAVVRTAVRQMLPQLEQPQSAREIIRHLVVPFKVTESELLLVIEELVASGECHVFPATTAKGKPRYASFGRLELGTREIGRVLAAKGPQTAAQLKKALKGFPDDEFREILDEGLAARRLWKHPPWGKVKQELIGRTPPSPLAYLREVGEQLAKIMGLLRGAEVPAEELRRAGVQLLAAAGIELSGWSGRAAEASTAAATPAFDLVALIRRLEPRANQGAVVAARDLRPASGLDKVTFDRAVLDLARQGRLSLHRHDFVASLTSAARDELVTDGAGTYYVGMALRSDAST
ncbi:MAG: hypothetical protein JSS02_16845 [Planctomycetes bacterium]|nr:hypothetical protein [Planctomycetota bacterium]